MKITIDIPVTQVCEIIKSEIANTFGYDINFMTVKPVIVVNDSLLHTATAKLAKFVVEYNHQPPIQSEPVVEIEPIEKQNRINGARLRQSSQNS